METHVKACGNELLNTPSEAVNQQLQFCIDTQIHTHIRIHMHTRTVHANGNGRRCDAMRGIIVTMGLEFPGKCSFVSSTVSYSSGHAIGALNVSLPLLPPPRTTAATSATAAAGNCICLQYLCHWLGLFLHYFVSIPNIFVFFSLICLLLLLLLLFIEHSQVEYLLMILWPHLFYELGQK